MYQVYLKREFYFIREFFFFPTNILKWELMVAIDVRILWLIQILGEKKNRIDTINPIYRSTLKTPAGISEYSHLTLALLMASMDGL